MLDWPNIRIHNHSQNNAFEELVCQLARHDIPEDPKQFYRLGTPDGGVECYWLLNDGSEIGWQAKYVFDIDSLLSQTDGSIKSSIKTHPNLKTFIVAIPFNLPGPHIGRGKKLVKSAQEKWDDKVSAWKALFSAKGRNVDIVLWNESHLNNLLIAPVNEGVRYYWFNNNELTTTWFEQKLSNSISDLGPRYAPELNIELDIIKYFGCLFRDNRCLKQIQCYHNALDNTIRALHQICNAQIEDDRYIDEYARLFHLQSTMIALLKLSDYHEMKTLPINQINQLLQSMEETCSSIWDISEREMGMEDFRRSPCYSALNKIFEVLDNGKHLFDDKMKLVNHPFMLLHGEPGVGKSHLLADVCSRQIRMGIPCILLLGEYFSAVANPREQIRQLLQISINSDTLLQSLNSIGQTVGQRILLAIDALNEGNGNIIWGRFLAGIVNDIEKYPWIALVVSIRSDYLDLIIPQQIQQSIINIEHRGFEDIFDSVCDEFFRYYGIESTVPILNQEFSNPLFLKLFCESRKNDKGLSVLPGLSEVFEGFQNHINDKLYSKFRYEPSLNIVKTIIEEIAKILVDGDLYAVTYTEFQKTIDEKVGGLLGRKSTDEYFNFLDALIKEGILRTFTPYNEHKKQVTFAYDRMKDYYVTIQRLEKKPANMDIKQFINSSPSFKNVFSSREFTAERVINILSIILPEMFGTELIACSPDGKVTHLLLKGFLASFIWRKQPSVPDNITKWLLNIAEQNEEVKKLIIDEFLNICVISGHPYNMQFIHENFLYPQTMGQLDSWWTPHINSKFYAYENTVYKRIVRWCWNINHPPSNISAESRLLLGMVLSWFCCATNRALRDRSTKALVCLYKDSVEEIIQLFEKMNCVQDIYVQERLYAAAYGVVLHSDTLESVKTLSDYFLQIVFSSPHVIPHILIRDYARNVVEYAIYCGLYDEKDIADIKHKITPPFVSSLPNIFPSDEDISQLEKKYDGYHGFWEICSSMKTGQNYGDFGRYVFASALHNFDGVNAHALSKWSILHILELGYDPSIHDQKTPEYAGRRSSRIERIGKKYQWITFFELLALVSDNCLITDGWGENKTFTKYCGPWNPYVRDIDPTLLIDHTLCLSYNQPEKAWYSPYDYLPLDVAPEEWIQDDPINIKNLIEMKDPQGCTWLALCSYPYWDEYPADFEEPKYGISKSMNGYIYSFLVTEDKVDMILELIKMTRNEVKDCLHDVNWYTVFDKEYYWSPAYSETVGKDGDIGWLDIIINGINTGIKCLQTTQRFLWEEEYDFSKKDKISYDIPSEFLYSGLGLQKGIVPCLYNIGDQMICYSPSILEEANHSLLIRKDVFYNWLKENNLSIIWMVTLEKYVSEKYMHRTKLWADYEGVYYFKDLELIGDMRKVDGS